MLFRSVLAGAALLALAAPALAEDAPNMIGKWIGMVDSAVMVGNTPDRTAEPGKKITFATESLQFTFDIKEQVGQRFGGAMDAPKRSETLIGHLYPDNKSGMMLDDDGQYFFNLSDANTMQLCYDHSKPDSKVIACWTAKRAQ
ncbi:MAG: hypothetical protein U1E16_08040 [Hyphomicrobiales bacterium]|uniref:hypothetical protein n=1 Tax=Aestuariivirga sp. TaxID=2650926 RepID=UPI0035AD91FC